MRLTEEIDAIEQSIVEDKQHDGFLFSASVALACFALLCLCWLLAVVWP